MIRLRSQLQINRTLVPLGSTYRYAYTGGHKPARPLETMTVGELWSVVDTYSAGTAGEPDLTSDPAAKELGTIEGNLMVAAASKLTMGELAGRG